MSDRVLAPEDVAHCSVLIGDAIVEETLTEARQRWQFCGVCSKPMQAVPCHWDRQTGKVNGWRWCCEGNPAAFHRYFWNGNSHDWADYLPGYFR